MSAEALLAEETRLMTANDIKQSIESGKGPHDASEFVETLTDKMVEGLVDVIDDLSDEVDDLEDQVLTTESHKLRPKISELRRHAIGLRRFLAPQREAVSRLFNEKLDWLTEIDRMRLRESADRITRFVEDLDLTRERAVVVQEELMSLLSEKMDVVVVSKTPYKHFTCRFKHSVGHLIIQ